MRLVFGVLALITFAQVALGDEPVSVAVNQPVDAAMTTTEAPSNHPIVREIARHRRHHRHHRRHHRHHRRHHRRW